MNNQERGLKIIDTFTDLQEFITNANGWVIQAKPNMAKNSTCRTTGCIGGWLDYYLGSTPGGGLWTNGVARLEDVLDLKRVGDFIKKSGLWHNNFGDLVFDASILAYLAPDLADIVAADSIISPDHYIKLRYGKISAEDVCSAWIQFGYELIAEEV